MSDELTTIRRRVEELETLETERKRTEEALQESEKIFRTIFESFEDIYYQTDLNGIITLISPSVYRISGWKPEELIGQPTTMVYNSPEDRVTLLKELTKQGYVRDYELTLLMRDGSKARASLAAHLIYDSSGAAAGLAGALRDITGRKRTEESLFKSEKKFAATFHLNPNPMAITDVATGKIVDANNAFSCWTGYGLEEVIGVSTLDLHFWVNPEDRKRIIDTLTAAGEINDAEVILMQRNGNLRNVLLSARFIEIEQERHMLTLVQDITERLKMEADLRGGEKRYREFADFLPQPVGEFDVKGNLSFVNRSFFKLFGYTKEDYDKGLNVFNMIIPEHHRIALDKIQRILNGESSDGSDYTMIRKDGSTFPAILFTSPVMHERKPLGLRAIMIDITDRKVAEGTLRESEATLRSVFKTNPVGLCIMKNRVYQSANKAWYEIFGYSESDIIGHTTRMLYQNEEEYARVGRELYTGLWESGLTSVRTQIRRKDGAFRDVILTAVPLDSEDLSLGALVTVEDITDRSRIEEELRESQRMLSDIIDFLPDATLVIDKQGKVIAWNRATENMTGVRAEDMLGKGNYEHALPFYGERRPILIDLALHADLENEKDYTAIRRIGDIVFGEAYTPKLSPGNIHLSGAASVLRDNKGEIVAAIECIRNNTERKKLESQLQQAQKMEAIGTLAGGIAHDFNNILSAILGYTDMALTEHNADDRVRRYLEQVYKAGERATDLVKQILAFSRQHDEKPRPLRVSPIIKEVLNLLRASLPSTIHIVQDIQCESDTVLADPIQIHQILMNLCTNAAYAMRGRNGELKVTLTTDIIGPRNALVVYHHLSAGMFLKLTISDTGVGMTPEIMSRIFDPFFTTKKPGEGTGMGLSVVYGIVKSCNGEVIVESEPDKGTEFQVYLPLLMETKSEQEIDKTAGIVGGKERVLFVDDEENLVQLGKYMLTGLGYEVVGTTSSVDALEVFRSRPHYFDFVITDMTMPNMTGVDLAKEMLIIRADIPIILCTGFSEIISEENAKSIGIRKFIMKPLLKNSLAMQIRDILDTK